MCQALSKAMEKQKWLTCMWSLSFSGLKPSMESKQGLRYSVSTMWHRTWIKSQLEKNLYLDKVPYVLPSLQLPSMEWEQGRAEKASQRRCQPELSPQVGISHVEMGGMWAPGNGETKEAELRAAQCVEGSESFLLCFWSLKWEDGAGEVARTADHGQPWR